MKRIWHTGVTVSDLDRSVGFYRDVLGLEMTVPPTEVIEGPEVDQGVGVTGARMRLAIFRVGDGELELIQYLSPASAVDSPMPPNTLGAMHLAFEVDDVAARKAELEAKGIKFQSRINVVEEGPLTGWKWVYFKDPDGILLELVEFKPPL